MIDLTSLTSQRGAPKVSEAELTSLLAAVPGWTRTDARLTRRFVFKDFARLMIFVNALAEVAEAEDHHPDFTVHYNQLDVSIWTHDVNGLTRNDFILAAKLDKL